MRSGHAAARRERRVLRRMGRELSAIPGFSDTRRPSPHVAKDFLGAAVTLAVIGVFGLQVTNGLASRCGTGPNPHAHPAACSGVAAVARHAQGAVTLVVISCAVLAAISFIWYLLWGYKIGGRVKEDPDASGRQSR